MNTPVCLGRIYRCAVCGAEVVVIHAASQALGLVCCNEPMQALAAAVQIYRCSVCGSEVAVLRRDNDQLDLICCHQAMVPREAVIPDAA